jgi:hypothetical protein
MGKKTNLIGVSCCDIYTNFTPTSSSFINKDQKYIGWVTSLLPPNLDEELSGETTVMNCITCLAVSVLPAPDSPVTRMQASSRFSLKWL